MCIKKISHEKLRLIGNILYRWAKNWMKKCKTVGILSADWMHHPFLFKHPSFQVPLHTEAINSTIFLLLLIVIKWGQFIAVLQCRCLLNFKRISTAFNRRHAIILSIELHYYGLTREDEHVRICLWTHRFYTKITDKFLSMPCK